MRKFNAIEGLSNQFQSRTYRGGTETQQLGKGEPHKQVTQLEKVRKIKFQLGSPTQKTRKKTIFGSFYGSKHEKTSTIFSRKERAKFGTPQLRNSSALPFQYDSLRYAIGSVVHEPSKLEFLSEFGHFVGILDISRQNMKEGEVFPFFLDTWELLAPSRHFGRTFTLSCRQGRNAPPPSGCNEHDKVSYVFWLSDTINSACTIMSGLKYI